MHGTEKVISPTREINKGYCIVLYCIVLYRIVLYTTVLPLLCDPSVKQFRPVMILSKSSAMSHMLVKYPSWWETIREGLLCTLPDFQLCTLFLLLQADVLDLSILRHQQKLARYESRCVQDLYLGTIQGLDNPILVDLWETRLLTVGFWGLVWVQVLLKVCKRVKSMTWKFQGANKVQFWSNRNYYSCYAAAMHKVQGMSLNIAVIYLGKKLFSPAVAYVALSRVGTLSGLVVTELNKNAVGFN